MVAALTTAGEFDLEDVMDPDGDEIPGRYKEFGREVRRILGWYGGPVRYTSRMAKRKTGVSHTTIADMANGDKTRMDLVLQFAEGFGVDPNPLLRALGYPEIVTKEPADAPGTEPDEIRPDERVLIENYRRAPVAGKQAILQSARAFAGVILQGAGENAGEERTYEELQQIAAGTHPTQRAARSPRDVEKGSRP